MARITLRLYNNDGYSRNSLRTLALAFSSKSKTFYSPTGIQLKVNQWDGRKGIVVRHPDAAKLTLEANKILFSAQEILLRLTGGFDIGLDARQIRDLVMKELNKETSSSRFVLDYMRKYMETKSKKNTRQIFQSTISRLLQFSPAMGHVMFDAVNPMWLRQFDKWLSENGCPSVNARSIHLRNIRTVFNAAIDDGITVNYPFRKLRIGGERGKNRDVDAVSLNRFAHLELQGTELFVRDTFMLSFYMMGINMADLILLETDGNKVEYTRQKTGKPYEFKVQPEAKRLLYVIDWVKHYRNAHSLTIMMNRNLKKLGAQIGYPELTTYWARHSWATIASDIDVPKDVIAAALGHIGNTVTDVYINFDHSKIDKANRAVIDYVASV